MAKNKKWSDLNGGERSDLLRDYRRMTGRAACAKHGVEYNSVRNSLSRAFRKAQHGGRRPGAGNKKGIKFCPICRAKINQSGKCSRDKTHTT